ncbi:tyrosine-type recombinase/integrase [Rhodoferax lithotrophicus]|nr:tyrosine-type recombinase/integrase [Rhodoferax sp. MIZ03]
MAIITVRELQALTVADNGKRISMGESMYGVVRVAADNVVSVYVVWRYKVSGKLRQIPVGTWKDKGGVSLKALRDRRDILAAEVKAHTDPIERRASAKLKRDADKQAAALKLEAEIEAAKLKAQADAAEAIQIQQSRLALQATEKARMTVRQLFDRWHHLDLRNRVKRGSDVLRSFEADVFPVIGDLAAEDVRKTHIQGILDAIRARATEDRPRVSTQKKTLSDMRQMFGWALERDYLLADPTAVIRKAKLGVSTERERVLTEAEVIELFQKLPVSGLTETSKVALMIQLSTASRIGETLLAHWAHVDFERRTWTIPAVIAKNGKLHTISLSDFALGQFQILHSMTGVTPWLFPNTELNASVCRKSTTKQVGDRQRYDKPILKNRSQDAHALELAGGRWVPHDLRRTAATMMVQLGVLPDVVEKCLNHTEPNKLKRIYQRASYEGAMREAWGLLGERLNLLHRRATGEAPNVLSE